jgi:hypothetical protein
MFSCRTCMIAAVLAWLACTGAVAAGEAELERRVLMDAASAGRWSAAESTLVPSTAHTRAGRAALHWHIPVDHHAGEAKYPIGWPRISYSIRQPAERNWAGWDYLEMWIHTRSSRATLPREPAGIAVYAPDKAGAFNRPLPELAIGQWAHVRIPLTQIPRHEDVRMFQLHISEARYAHGDTLDFFIDEIVLLRYARPTLLEFSARESTAFADAPSIRAHFTLAGVPPGEQAEVVCELQRDGRTMAATAAKLGRGPGQLAIDLGQTRLAPGEYQLLARVAGGGEASARVRLVESPWAEDKR